MSYTNSEFNEPIFVSTPLEIVIQKTVNIEAKYYGRCFNERCNKQIKGFFVRIKEEYDKLFRTETDKTGHIQCLIKRLETHDIPNYSELKKAKIINKLKAFLEEHKAEIVADEL